MEGSIEVGKYSWRERGLMVIFKYRDQEKALKNLGDPYSQSSKTSSSET